MRYGVPYMGSKNSIAKALCEQIPVHGFKHFYDLFAGGCAVTHRMLELGNFETYTINDIDDAGIEVFTKAIKGEYKKSQYLQWVSREEFFAQGNSNPFIALCWSFGNQGQTYIYGSHVEQWKKALHYAVVYEDYTLLDEFDTRLKEIISQGKDWHERRLLVKKCKQSDMMRVEALERLQSLEALERLKALENTTACNSLKSSHKSYDEVEIEPSSVIYCDIPYKNTGTYRTAKQAPFDYDKFYSWAEQQKELVLISEYTMPEERFAKVWETRKTVSMCAQKTTHNIEKLFVPKHQLELYTNRIKTSVNNKNLG